jgi:dolichol-phosphate mannosyltransferase
MIRALVAIGRGLGAETPSEIVRFALVGGSGVVVNMGVLYALHGTAGWPLIPASVLAVEAAILNNFFWNDRWTFKTRHGARYRFIRFNLISLGDCSSTP